VIIGNDEPILPDAELDALADGFSLEIAGQIPAASNIRAARAELASRELCRRHFLPFVQRFNPNYTAGWVHEEIARKLEAFSDAVARKESPRLMIFMPFRSGKQLADSTPVWTTRGLITHGELRKGDFVFTPDGKSTEVVAVSAKTPSDMVLTTTDGTEIRCHENHDWVVYDRGVSTTSVKSTAALAKRTLWSSNRAVLQLPEARALDHPPAELPMDAYTLGAWLGDGTTSSPNITHHADDTQTVDEIASRGYEISNRWTHAKTKVVTTSFAGPKPGVSGRLWREIKALGLNRGKHIPEVFFTASIEQRLDILAGLIDTDGHVDSAGRIKISTVLPRLVGDVEKLLATLGMRAYITANQPKTSTSGIVGRKIVYVIAFQATLPIPVRIPRKQRIKVAPPQRMGIRSIEYRPNGEVGHCIQVANPNGTYVVGDTRLIVTHNSELTSRRFPSWHLGKYPHHEFIAASHTVNLSLGFSRRNRAMLRDAEYQLIFEDTKLDQDSQSAEEWLTTAGGAYLAAGVGSGIAGRGAHVLMIDDPVRSMEDADSAPTRDSNWEWYTADAYSRLAPGGGILLIMTRWHEDDLAGRLLADMKAGGEQWDVISYEAIATQDEAHRKQGEALHPERYDEAAWARIRRVIGERKFSALCQQSPTPEVGHYFTRQMFRYYDPDELDSSKLVGYQAWDLAVTTNTWSDYTVGITAGVDQHDDIYILDRVREKVDSFETMENICDAYIKYRNIIDIVGIEAGQIEKSIGPFLDKALASKNLYDLHLLPLPPGRADKAARAQSIRGLMRQGKVWFPHPDKAPWVHELIDECLRFQAGGAHDDQVDALAWLGQMVTDMVGYSEKKVKPKKSWKDKLTLIPGGYAGSAMSA